MTHDEVERPGPLGRRFPGTDMPTWILLGLIALGLPRTILADLGIIVPEGSWVYFVLALTPFAVWLAVAIILRTKTPIRDHLVTGALYGLSLVIVHEVLWGAEASLGHHPPQSAVALAEQLGPEFREPVLHAYSFGIAMLIGLGVGLIAGIVAVIANRVRKS